MLDILPMYALIESIRVHFLDGFILLLQFKSLSNLVLHGEVRTLPIELHLTVHIM